MTMSSALNDEDLALSINSSSHRRKTTRATEQTGHEQHQEQAHQRRHGRIEHPLSKTGQLLDDYIIKKTLGEGSFGKVKLAVHKHSGQNVALKIISRKKLVTRDMTGRIEREIQYLQLLRHPHIIKL